METGAIIACALNEDRDALPRFEGKAVVTSDGFIQCGFVTRNGEYKNMAFVGSLEDLDRNLAGLAKHLKLCPADQNALNSAVTGWIATDWRV